MMPLRHTFPVPYRHRRAVPGRAPQAGLSLVELMVGLAIGLVLSLGLVVMLSGTSRNFKVQDDFARLQENGALALRYLLDDVRTAGFYGWAASVGSIDPTLRAAIAIANDCGAAVNAPGAALNMELPISVDNTLTPASVAAAYPCITGNNFLSGSPVIALRGAPGYRVWDRNNNDNLLDDLTAEPNFANTIYVQSSPAQDPNTIIFQGSGYAALRASGQHRAYTPSSGVVCALCEGPVFEYQSHVYYIRPCSRPTPPATDCSPAGTDDGGRSIPTLVRHELVGTVMQLTPLVEGVERLTLLYGVDDNQDGIPDRYTGNPAGLGESITAVRIDVLVRTTTRTAGYDDAGKTYNLGGGVVFTCTPGVDCDFKRHVFSQTAQVRNCAQRRGLVGTC
ncbi:MAG: PilW family protein [Zoogloeaceae bacterium]|nr:PilW family protein [Zoogloeaceae bacterium]